jgi:hypothetical protein
MELECQMDGNVYGRPIAWITYVEKIDHLKGMMLFALSAEFQISATKKVS